MLDLPEHTRRADRYNVDRFAVFYALDLGLAVEAVEPAALVVGQVDGHAARTLVQLAVDRTQQLVKALAGTGADVHRALAARADITVEEVGLVVHADAGDPLRAEIVNELIDDLRLRDPLGVGDVNDVQQQVGVLQLLKRRLERVDKLMRQLADEADRVGDHNVERVGDGQHR